MEREEELECRKVLLKDGKYRTFDDLFLIRARLLHGQFLSSHHLHCLHQWEFDDLCHKITLINKADGEVVYQQGDIAEGFYLILTGEVLEFDIQGSISLCAGDFFGLGDESCLDRASLPSDQTLVAGKTVEDEQKGPEENNETAFPAMKPAEEEAKALPSMEVGLINPVGDSNEKTDAQSPPKEEEKQAEGSETPGNLSIDIPALNRLKSDLWHVDTPHSVSLKINEQTSNTMELTGERVGLGLSGKLGHSMSSEIDINSPCKSGGAQQNLDGFSTLKEEDPAETEQGNLPADQGSRGSLDESKGSQDTKGGVFSVTGAAPPAFHREPVSRNESQISHGTLSTLSIFQPDPRLWEVNPVRSSSVVAKGDVELVFIRFADYENAINNTGTTAMLDLINPPPPKKVKPPWSKKKISLERPKSNYEITLDKARHILALPVSQRAMQDLDELAYLLSLRIEFLKQFTRSQQVRFLQHMWISAIWERSCVYNFDAKAKAFHIVFTGNVELMARSTIYDFDSRVTEVHDASVKQFEVFGDKEIVPEHKSGKRERSAWTVEKFNEILSIDHKKFNEIMAECKVEQLEACTELLLRTEGFNFFTQKMCWDVAQHMEQRRLEINEALCMQRRKATEIIIIQRGECQVQRSLSMGKTRNLLEEREQNYISIGRIGPRTALGLYIIAPEIQVSDETYWRETVTSVSNVLAYTIPRVAFYTLLPQEYRMEVKRGLSKMTHSVTGLWGQVPSQVSLELVQASNAWDQYRRKLVTGEMHNSVRRPQSPSVGFGSGLDLEGQIPIAPLPHPSQQNLLPMASQVTLSHLRPKSTSDLSSPSKALPRAKRNNEFSKSGTLSTHTKSGRLNSPSKHRPRTTDARLEKIALKRQDSKKEWDNIMKQYDITRPMRQSDRYKKGENVYERWCPFQVLEIKANQKSSECFFRVLGGFKTVEDAQISVLALYGGGSRIEKTESGNFSYAKAVMGERWQQFQSYELLNLSKPHHVIIFCLDAPIEYVSFKPGDQDHAYIKDAYESARIWKSSNKDRSPLDLPGVTFPAFSKVIAQEWSTISLKEFKLDKSDRQKYVLESLLHPPFFRQITLVSQIHGCFATKHHAARAAYSLKESGTSNKTKELDLIIVPMYTWLPCKVEDLRELHIDNDEVRALMEEETQQLGIEIRGHTLNGLTTSIVHRNKKNTFKLKNKILSQTNMLLSDGEFKFDWAMVKKLQARDNLQKNVQEKSRRRRAMRDTILKASLDANETEKKLNERIFSMNKPSSKNDRKEIQLRQLKDKAQMDVFVALNNLDYKKVLETADDELFESVPGTPGGTTIGKKLKDKKKKIAKVPLNEKLQVLDSMLSTKKKWEFKMRDSALQNDQTHRLKKLVSSNTTKSKWGAAASSITIK
mmetsp:Transcript_28147/g.36557  ORF Transcript_28147/g.36557 Transcript_28147/m.36557 type:complete len:1389 (-) Transcript_28147:300-4466(-)